MKRTLAKNTLLAFFAFSVLLSCKREDPLPAATRSGANTFGCKVNGKTWIPDGGGGFSGIKPVEGGYQGNYDSTMTKYNVFVRAMKKDKSGIHLYLRGVVRPGIYQLNQFTNIRYTELRPLNYGAYFPDPGQAFVTNPQYTGTVNITRADTANKIVSGTFAFTVYDPDLKQTIRITDGRFDVDYKRQ